MPPPGSQGLMMMESNPQDGMQVGGSSSSKSRGAANQDAEHAGGSSSSTSYVVGMRKMTPSEIISKHQNKNLGRYNMYNADSEPVKIVQFLNIGLYTHNERSRVPIGEPLFRPNPPVVEFFEYRALRTYETQLYLRNQDDVARRCKVFPPDSGYFEVIPSKKNRDKVAAGMEICYTIRFKPDSRQDYSYDLQVVTEREKFIVPIRAIGYHALLDFPDLVDFGSDCPVRMESVKTILMRNVGEKATRFCFQVAAPFSVSIQDGYLDPDSTLQVQIFFKPDRTDTEYERELILTYGDSTPMVAHVKLKGSAAELDIQFETRNVQMPDTYIALMSQATVDITNNSDHPVDFSWRAFGNAEDEIQQKLKLGVQLKEEETEEQLFVEQMALEMAMPDPEDGDDGDDQATQQRSAAQLAALKRKYANIAKAVLDDPMYFYDTIFSMEPLSGRIWAKSRVTVTISFSPKSALHYHCLAYCSIAGQQERIPIKLTGHGIGPKAAFSFDEMDVGDIFVESMHRYEVDIVNQGDIAVNYELMPNTSPFGSKFSFTPASGRLEVDGQETLQIDFCPNILGEFHETFMWELSSNNKSACAIPISFKGNSVCPTFHFDVDKINFGTVSFGFLNCKTITLSNDSEVTMRYVLRIPGDGRFLQKEFDVIPSKGVLLPNCSQKIQIDFISAQANPNKSYDLALVVDLDGVGQELGSVPITAKCAVPTVVFEPYEAISFGEVFIRYAFCQCLVMHNTSSLPAKFQILPQDEQSKQIAEFEPDQTQGNVPPASSHVITITLTAKKIPKECASGQPMSIPMYVKILGQPVPYPFQLTAIPIGPRVEVECNKLDWGNTKCLTPVTKTLKVTNNSVIDAAVRCFLKSRNSLWSVKPKKLHLAPNEVAYLHLTLVCDEKQALSDILHLVVHESNDIMVNVKAKGTGTPITSQEDISKLDFGTVYATQTHTRDIFVENRGKKARRLVWSSEKMDALQKFLSKKTEDEDGKSKRAYELKLQELTPVFSVTPDTVTLDGKSMYRFTFTAMSARPGSVSEVLTCTEFVGANDRKGQVVLTCELRGEFIAPLLQLSAQALEYKFEWSQEHGYSKFKALTHPLAFTNVSPLDVKFHIKCPYPFSIDKMNLTLVPGEKHTCTVAFDPNYMAIDKLCDVNKQKLTITYSDHPQKDSVDLVGEVVFPNLVFDAFATDFGAILNMTSKTQSIRVSNPYPLPVNFEFALVDEDTVKCDMDGKLVEVPMGQVFDVLPIGGTIDSGSSVDVQFTYFGLGNRKIETHFVCLCDGGPDYTVACSGIASDVEYRLDKIGGVQDGMSVGDVLFNQTIERDLCIRNMGKVPFYYSVDMTTLKRPLCVDVFPQTGLIQPEDKTFLKIRFCPGIPDWVEEHVLISVAHYEPIKFTINGRGIFPNLVFELERAERAAHLLKIEEARVVVQKRMEELGASSSPEEDMNHEGSRMKKKSKKASDKGSGTGDPSSDQTRPPSASSKSSAKKSTKRETVSNGTPRSGTVTAVEVKNHKSLMLMLESEVDRTHLSEILLQQEEELFLAQRADPSKMKPTTSSKKKGKKKDPGVVAASYVCDFGYIVLGHSKKKNIVIHNCYHDTVQFEIKKKELDAYGFAIEPQNAKKIPSHDKITLTCEAYSSSPEEEAAAAKAKGKDGGDPLVQGEGPVSFAWKIPVKNGPQYEVHLKAFFVLPEIVVSSENIDFGRVLVGQKKIVTISIKNKKPVPIEWSWKTPKASGGKPMPKWDVVYQVKPDHGTLAPDEIQWVEVAFTPNSASSFKQKLGLKIRDNPHKKMLTCSGHGDVLNLKVDKNHIELAPCLPYYDRALQGLYLENPTDYPITVYSADFDQQYRMEEQKLDAYREHDSLYKYCEFPVREDPSTTWPDVEDTWDQLQRAKEWEERRQLRKAERDKEFADKVEATNAGKAEGAKDITVVELHRQLLHQVQDFWKREYIAIKDERGEALPMNINPETGEYSIEPGSVPEIQPWDDIPDEIPNEEEQNDVYLWIWEAEEERFVRDTIWDPKKIKEVESAKPEIKTERDHEVEAMLDLGLEENKFPNRVPQKLRENVVIHGPQRSGRTRWGNQIHANSQRGFLSIDEAVDWALSGSAKGLFSTEFLDKIRATLTEREQLWESDAATKTEYEAKIPHKDILLNRDILAGSMELDGAAQFPTYDLAPEDVVHILKKRLALCDFNTGFVLNGFDKSVKYLTPENLIQTLFLLNERIRFFVMEPSRKQTEEEENLDGITESGSKLEAEGGGSPTDGAEEEEEDPEVLEQRRIEKYEANLQMFLDLRVSEIEADIAATKEEIEALTKKVADSAGDEDIGDQDELNVLDQRVGAANAEIEVLKKINISANREFVDHYKNMLKELIAPMNAKKAEELRALALQQAQAKQGRRGKTKTAGGGNDGSKSNSPTSRAGNSDAEAGQIELQDYHQITDYPMPYDAASRRKLPEPQDMLAAPRIPEDPRLPEPSFRQIVYAPKLGRDFDMDEAYKLSKHNFSLLTPIDSKPEALEQQPVPETDHNRSGSSGSEGVEGLGGEGKNAVADGEAGGSAAEGHETSKEESAVEAAAAGEGVEDGAEGEPQKTQEELLDLSQCTNQTRWVIPPQSRVKIFVKFFSDKTETVGCRLHFEVVQGYHYLHNDPKLVKENQQHCFSIIDGNEALREAAEEGGHGATLALEDGKNGSPAKSAGAAASPSNKNKAADPAAFQMPFPPVSIARAMVTVAGRTAFPHINNNPTNIFMRRVRTRPQPPIYISRQYVSNRDLYEFGPLLVGKDPEVRHFYTEDMLHLPKKLQLGLDRQLVEREQTGYVFSALEGISTKNSTRESWGEQTVDGEVAEKRAPLTDEEKIERKAAMRLEQEKDNQLFFLRKHVECFRITNNSLFPLRAFFCLASSQKVAGTTATVAEKLKQATDAVAARDGPTVPSEAYEGLVPTVDTALPFPIGEFETYPFIVSPEVLELQQDETKEVTVWCFPRTEQTVSDQLVVTVDDNPECVVVPLTATGTVPKLEVSSMNLDFDKLMLRQSDARELELRNPGCVNVYWKLQNVFGTEKEPVEGEEPPAGEDLEFTIPPQYTIEPKEGILSPGAACKVKVVFKATKANVYNFKLRFAIQDTEGFYLSGLAKTKQDNPKGEEEPKIVHTPVEMVPTEVEVSGECFEVDVGVEFPNERGLDFGALKVGESKTEQFEIVNHGKYPLRYELKIKKKSIMEILSIKDDVGRSVEIAPEERRVIKVTAVSFKQVKISDAAELFLRIFEARSMERVEPAIPPIKVSVQAVYNGFTVTPPRGLNFGPVRSGADPKTRTFEIRNDGVFPFEWCLMDLSAIMSDPNIQSTVPPPAASPKGGRSPRSPKSRGASPRSPGGRHKQEKFIDPSVLARPPAEYFQDTLQIGPFEISPAKGTLDPISEDGEKSVTRITVKFTANGDRDEDKKLALWVDGVEPNMPDQIRVGDINNLVYLLTGQSCIPGIDTNMQWVFEEQYVARNLEDAIATAGRVDIRCYAEEDRVFSFGPCLAGGAEPQKERLRITNPRGIQCEVSFSVKARTQSGGGDFPFEIQPAQLLIPPHEHRYVTVSFAPPQLQTYYAIFEAKVTDGLDPRTNYLTFEIRGDGTVPSITLEGVDAMTDGKFDFGKLQLGREHAIQFRLQNDGIIPATARLEILNEEGEAVTDTVPHFSLICPSTVNLDPGKDYSFSAKFHPCHVGGPYTQQFRVYTMHNPFEDVKLALEGEGFVQDVCWELFNQQISSGDDELLDLDMSPEISPFDPPHPLEKGGRHVTIRPPAPPDELGLGELPVGSRKQQTIYLKNGSKKTVRFEFPEVLPAPFAVSPEGAEMTSQTANLKFTPSCGHVPAGSKKKIVVVFQPCEKISAELVAIPCKIQDIEFVDASEQAAAQQVGGADGAAEGAENGADGSKNLEMTFLRSTSHEGRSSSHESVGGSKKPLLDWDDSMTIMVEEEVDEQIEGAEPLPMPDDADPDTYEPQYPTRKVRRKAPKTREEPPHRVLPKKDEEGNETEEPSESDMPLKVTAAADDRGFECETERIHFAPTMMFGAKLFTFSVKNSSAIALPYEWRVSNMNSAKKNYEITPKVGIIPTDGSSEFTVRFQPTEVEDFRSTLSLFTFKHQVFGDPSGKTSPVYVPHGSAMGPDGEPIIDYPEDDGPFKVPLHSISLNGSAVRPLCHFELPASNYQSATSDDPKQMIIEFPPSLGTRVRNTKRFYVLNPTGESYDFIWTEKKKDASASSGDHDQSGAGSGAGGSGGGSGGAEGSNPFRCLTKHGHILSGKKFEMVFEYIPQSIGAHESSWSFTVIGKNVEQNFLVVGHVKEPRVGFQQPFLNFGRLLLGGKARETLYLVNKEHIPFSFHFDKTSYGHEPTSDSGNMDNYGGGSSMMKAPTIFISPEQGVVGGNSSFPVEVLYRPIVEEAVSYNVVCKVKRKEQPLALKVKGEGYKIHAQLLVKESIDRLLHPGVKEVVDFGSNLQVHERREAKLVLKNSGSFNFDFVWQIIYQGKKLSDNGSTQARRSAALPPYLSISQMQGVAPQEGEVEFTVEYAPLDTHTLDGCILKLMIPSARQPGKGGVDESCYLVELSGRARRPQVDFSFTTYDFGYCFIDKRAGATIAGDISKGNCFKKVDLVVTNRDLSDCLLSTNFQRTAYLDVQLDQSMIEAGQSMVVPIVFQPRDSVEYRERIEFVINDFTKFYVNVRGKGTPLKLELVSMDMQTVDFGVTIGNKPPIRRQIKLINKSPCPCEFLILDPEDRLRDRSVSWTTPMGGSSAMGSSTARIGSKEPPQRVNLRPKEQCPIDLSFSPQFRVAPFKYPLNVMCQQTGETIHLATVCGECHATEIKLSEHSILFPPVVVQSRASEKVHLHNFGDLGSKYKFEIPARFQDIFFIKPVSGYVAPHDDQVLEVSFCPKQVVDRDITCENIVCLLDNHEPIRLSLTGRCIAQPSDAVHTLNFQAEVRKEQVQSITFPPTAVNNTQVWKLQPEVKTLNIPSGISAPGYFFCPSEVVVQPNGTASIDVIYRPLTMTRPDDVRDDGTVIKDLHKGSLFIATPDGKAYVYQLEGRADPPTLDQRIEVEVPCKTQHTQVIPLQNWLNQRQRFNVKLSLMDPPPDSEDAGAVKISGIEVFDLPPKLKRDYKFQVYAFRVTTVLVLAEFENPSSGEFIRVEVAFKFTEPKSLAVIKFETACRQIAKWPIMVSNPLSKPVTFSCSSTIPDVYFAPHGASFEVPPHDEVYMDVCFRPSGGEGEGEGEVVLECPELGSYPYKVVYKATSPAMEKSLVFKAPLGSSVTESFRFLHYAKKAGSYVASVVPVPGGGQKYQGRVEDFQIESKDIKAGEGPVEVGVEVKYEPSSMAEMRGILVVKSPETGTEYKTTLVGYSGAPQAKGPVVVAKSATIEFRNPFHDSEDFVFALDNPNDFKLKVETKQKIEGLKTVSVGIDFVGPSAMGSRLVVTTAKSTTPWIYFLKGQA
ncbi:unnamed protein product [Amoebophrya sp. A25]|nr:unnamed protein product [Amoebophrya sp. A25]|eukprot:GSA25T00021962001.1